MLLEVKGLNIPPQYMFHALYSDLEDGHPRKMRDNLVQLKDAPWPEDVKAKIVESYKAIGIESPLRQKLVDPFCKHFGGLEIDGNNVLDFVNWFKVVDYFEWEATAWLASHELPDGKRDAFKRAEKLQDRAIKKHRGLFSHYYAYGEY